MLEFEMSGFDELERKLQHLADNAEAMAANTRSL